MKFSNPYWSTRLKISTLQRWILVHSILYYEMNESVIDDHMFDRNAYQLVDLQKASPADAEASTYWYVFYDFDASTGFHLYDRLTKDDKEYLGIIASNVLRLSKSKIGGKK